MTANTPIAIANAAAATVATDRAGAVRAVRDRVRTIVAACWSPASGRDDAHSHTADATAQASNHHRYDVVRARAPPTAIIVVLETIENARSRRRGTSNACSTCTHRNSAASGARAASGDVT
jgi:hypothetical protein